MKRIFIYLIVFVLSILCVARVSAQDTMKVKPEPKMISEAYIATTENPIVYYDLFIYPALERDSNGRYMESNFLFLTHKKQEKSWGDTIKVTGIYINDQVLNNTLVLKEIEDNAMKYKDRMAGMAMNYINIVNPKEKTDFAMSASSDFSAESSSFSLYLINYISDIMKLRDKEDIYWIFFSYLAKN